MRASALYRTSSRRASFNLPLHRDANDGSVPSSTPLSDVSPSTLVIGFLFIVRLLYLQYTLRMDYVRPREEETMSEAKPHQPAEPRPTAETLALLKILKLGDRQIEAGQFRPAAEVFAQLRKRHEPD